MHDLECMSQESTSYSNDLQRMLPDRPSSGQRRFREVLSQQLQLALFCAIAIVGMRCMVCLAAVVLFDVSSLNRMCCVLLECHSGCPCFGRESSSAEGEHCISEAGLGLCL